MGLITNTVKMKVKAKLIKHLESLGYTIPKKEPSSSYKLRRNKEWVYDTDAYIEINICDLPNGSRAMVDCKCDYCGEIVSMPYKKYTKIMEGIVPKISCYSCNPIKQKEIVKLKYNVDCVFQLDEIKEKSKKTNQLRRGVDYPTQSPEVKQKIINSFYENQSVSTSNQQRYLAKLYNMEINYPILYWNVDLYDKDSKICCEYDGNGHQLSVDLGFLSQEEFDKKQEFREKSIINEGYKMVHIVSKKDRLPSDTVLRKMLIDAKTYFSHNPNNSWLIYDIDNSIIKNENDQNGLHYTYGKLRLIKKQHLESA